MPESQTPPEHDTATVESGDVSIFYRIFGIPGATPILIAHGQSYFSWDWIEIASALAEGREVVAMDMRGFGNSSWSPSKAYKVQDFAADILAIAEARGWDRMILVGHSMGGRNVTYTAAAHPERVEKLVLVDYTPTNAKAGSQRVMNQSVDMPEAFADIDEALRYFGKEPDNVDRKTRTRFENYLMPVEGGVTVRRDTHFKEQFRKMRDEGVKPDHGADLWECLGKIQCPILVLRGKSSDMFAPETVDKVKQTNPNAKVVEVEGGHNIPGDNPDGLIAEVRKFL